MASVARLFPRTRDLRPRRAAVFHVKAMCPWSVGTSVFSTEAFRKKICRSLSFSQSTTWVYDSTSASSVLYDVVYGQFAVPAIVEVHSERAQTRGLDEVQDIGAVHAAAGPDDAIAFLVAPFRSDLLYDLPECGGSFRFLDWEQAIARPVDGTRAVVIAALVIEIDVRVVRRVYDTTCADGAGPRHGRHSPPPTEIVSR